MRADIHGDPEQKLQSEAGYIDARPQTDNSTKTSCNARPDHAYASNATEMACSYNVRFPLESDRLANIPVGSFVPTHEIVARLPAARVAQPGVR
jgi:hypothetical protein